jgi:hypothetical protein
MKRALYIISFTFLGLLLSFVLHALLEIWYIKMLVANFARYGLGMDWKTWFQLHYYWSGSMLLLGGLWGFIAGKYWWRRIYILNKYGKR